MEEAPDRSAAEAMMIANLDWIERTTASLCRRHGISGDEADDVAAWIKLKLAEDDYAPLRKFRGDSSIRTYLVVVVTMLFRDYRAGHWGRWRPSATALRAGPLAVRLETLIYRDGCTLSQAAEVLRSSGETDAGDRDLAQLLAQLPVRGPLRPVEEGEAALRTVHAGSADAGIHAEEAEQQLARVRVSLERVLNALPEEDRLILRLMYWKGLSVGDVARALHLPQKPLYRRIESLFKGLRREMKDEGVDPSMLREALEGSTDP
jgi:RNA polymerase sigma factor (sigma-70 family)